MDESVQKHLTSFRELQRPLDEVGQLMLKAAAMIEDHGHCQSGVGEDASGRVCVMIALARCNDFGPLTWQAEKRIKHHIGWENTENLSAVAAWSDATPTAEVLATMRSVALGGE